jgi:membrane protein implicated in regulation of membrane protease activity
MPHLPGEYVATAVYRGVETYSEVGYYYAEATFASTKTESETKIYIVVAEYETEAIIPPIDEPLAEDFTDDIGGTKDDDGIIVPIADNTINEQTGNLIVDLINGNVPLGNFSTSGMWSLLSMILAFAGIIIACVSTIIAVVKRRRAKNLDRLNVYNEKRSGLARRRVNLLRALTIIIGLITLFIWLFLDNLNTNLVWVNSNTITVIILFAVTLVLCRITNRRDRTDLDHEESEKGAEEPSYQTT